MADPNMTPEQQLSAVKRQNWHTMKNNVELMHHITLRCFGDCVHTFRTKDLETKEGDCMKTCFQKTMAYMARASQLVTEEGMRMQTEMSLLRELEANHAAE
jgi:hypothetical protein